MACEIDTLLVVQARMTSTRLPGKVLLPVLGKPLLAYQIERLRRADSVGDIVVATTTNATDDPIVQLCSELGVRTFRGSEDDVLSRYYLASQPFAPRFVVRCTADCPVIDWGLVDEVVTTVMHSEGRIDYASNALERTYPIGLDCEAFTFKTLQLAYFEAQEALEREHVTPFIYARPERFRIAKLQAKEAVPQYRWTVDTPEDFALIREIISTLYPRDPAFRWTDVLSLMRSRPDLLGLNAHVEHRVWNKRYAG